MMALRAVQVWSYQLAQLGLKKKEVQQRAALLRAVSSGSNECQDEAWRQLRLALNLDRCA
jgi:hypothetical protein